MSPLSLYFHIPFCTRKCDYCHFYVIPEKDQHKEQLVEGFKYEWESWLPKLQDHTIETIYFGGGTPALLGPHYIEEILSWIKQSIPFSTNSPEITLEANPENVTFDLIRAYAEVGINRVSIGVQTLDEKLLQVLNRLHHPKKAIESIYLTKKAGIDNISIDLMYDLPGQTLEIWNQTLAEVTQLPITHLSLYNLTIEPHTQFFKKRDFIQKQQPPEEVSLEMYETAISTLTKWGLIQYEISAFCKDNLFSKHNHGYWTARPFIGLGPSAFSYFEGKRFRNIANLNRYWKAQKEGSSSIDFEEKLSSKESLRELLAIRLRLIDGVDLLAFQNHFGPLDTDTLKCLEKLKSDQLIEIRHGKLALTRRGILLYDFVASELI